MLTGPKDLAVWDLGLKEGAGFWGNIKHVLEQELHGSCNVVLVVPFEHSPMALEVFDAFVILQQIEITVIARGLEVAHVGKKGVARLLAPKPVQRAVGQDALEQHRQLVGDRKSVV